MRGAGVDMVPEPELEHHQRPEPVSMFAAAFDVLGDKGAHAVGAEQATVEWRYWDFLWCRTEL